MHCTPPHAATARAREKEVALRENRDPARRLSRGNKNGFPDTMGRENAAHLLTSLQRLRRCAGAQDAPWRMVKMRYACDTQARRHNQQTALLVQVRLFVVRFVC